MGIKGFANVYETVTEEPHVQGTPMQEGDTSFVILHPVKSEGSSTQSRRSRARGKSSAGSLIGIVDHSCLVHKHARGSAARKKTEVKKISDVFVTDEEVVAIAQAELTEIIDIAENCEVVYMVYDGPPTVRKKRKQKFTLMGVSTDLTCTCTLESLAADGDPCGPYCTRAITEEDHVVSFVNPLTIERAYKDSNECTLAPDFVDAYVKSVSQMPWSNVRDVVLKFAKYRGSYLQAVAWEGVWADLSWNKRAKTSLLQALVTGMPPATKKIRRALEEIVAESELYNHFQFVDSEHEADYKIADLAMDAVEAGDDPIIISNDSDTTILGLGVRKWSQSGSMVIQDAMTFWTTAYVSVRSAYRSLRSEGSIRELRAYLVAFLTKEGNEHLLALVGDGENEFKWLDRHLCCVLIVLAALYYNKSDYHNGVKKRGPSATVEMILNGELEVGLLPDSLHPDPLYMWFPAMVRIADYFRKYSHEISVEVTEEINAEIIASRKTQSGRKSRRLRIVKKGWSRTWIEKAIEAEAAFQNEA